LTELSHSVQDKIETKTHREIAIGVATLSELAKNKLMFDRQIRQSDMVAVCCFMFAG